MAVIGPSSKCADDTHVAGLLSAFACGQRLLATGLAVSTLGT